MNLAEFKGYFAKQLNEVKGVGGPLYYGITDFKQHTMLDIDEGSLNMLYEKLVSEGYVLAYPVGTTFRLPWFELKEINEAPIT